MKEIVWKIGQSIAPDTGYVENAFGLENKYQDRMADFHLRKAWEGDKIELLDFSYIYAIATYNLSVPEQFIYTYCYQPEENWTTYNQDYTEDNFTQEKYTFSEDAYFRIVLKRVDGRNLTEADVKKATEVILFSTTQHNYDTKPCLIEEIKKTAEETNVIRDDMELHGEKTMTFAVLTDSHYVVNGHWEDTEDSINQVHQKIGLDGILHLGDLTDGMIPRELTEEYASKIMGDLKRHQIPVHIALGNHDSNYFADNLEKMNFTEQSRFYLGRDTSNYYVDYEKIAVRFIFLTSFDYREKVRYGFAEQTLVWLNETLDNTSQGHSVIICSHVPPLPQIHYWSDEIRNGEQLIAILETYQSKAGCHIMAYLHGHNHGDQIYEERTFPIIAIGCSKCEYFTDKKPKGTITYERKLGTREQELWDVMVLSNNHKKIEFIRFGAGINRSINCKKRLRRVDGVIELNQDTLRKLQLIQVEMLLEVDRICKKCGIQYNIFGGTLLGAVRHKGYIPWDDDADVAFLRAEYEKFRKACETELDKDKFYFQDHTNTPGYRWGYGKIRRKDTLFLREYQEHMPYEQGVFIDIFPLDTVPDNYMKRILHQCHCFCIRKVLWSEVGKLADKRWYMRKWYALLSKIPEKTIFGHYDKFMKKGNQKESKLIRMLTFPTPANKVFGFNRKLFENSADISFEGHLLRGIANYKAYLKFTYGDYMTLPPEGQRKVHPVSDIKLL